ncbi:MAG: diguanylate cyclase [Chloroflexi bacterium]|nr:diguanylate cyclase [Chloroflexota bacterium]
MTWVTIMVRNPLAVIGAAIVVLAFLLAVVGPSILPYDPVAPDVSIRLRPPSAEHLFGTDRVGRDILARVIEGLRVTLSVATGAVAIALLVGTPIGAIAGYYGRGVDAVLMRLIDALMAFPSRLLAIALVATMGASVMSLWWAIAVTAVPRYARIMRGGVLAQREREYVQAARVSGERDLAILFREILPNASAPILIQLSIDFAHAVLIESSLSFLGLGLAPPTISWGQMLNEAKTYMEFAPWTAIFPGAAISLLILGFNLFGDGLRDAFDPRNA